MPATSETRYEKVDRAFRFLHEKSLDGTAFTVPDLMEATGWSRASVLTYISKQWRDFITGDGGEYRVRREFQRLDLENFKEIITQTRRAVTPAEFDYDVALSFAGEDRLYVEQVANVLRDLDVAVFYDHYEQAGLWGKDLVSHLDDVYRRKSRYCVLFLSHYYRDKVWTNHERASAQARAMESAGEYLLPARFDDTEIPGIRPTTGYIDISQMAAEEFAYLILEKIGRRDEVEEMITYMKEFLPNYDIWPEGSRLRFRAKDIFSYGDKELFEADFHIRLMLEMYRTNEFESMFILPSIVPLN